MICTGIAPLYAQPVQETGKILMLYAYDPNTPGVVAFAQQLKMVVNEQFQNRVEIYDEYLDLNRFPDFDRSPQLARYFAEKYRGFRPDAIVAEGTPALRFATERLSSLFPGVPIVYGQAFEPVVDFSALPANVTGRRQPLPFASTYSLARALQPDAERVVVVGGASEMDSLLLSVALREITPLLNGMELKVLQDWSYESLIDSLRRIPPRTFVIFSSFSRDQRGRKFIPGDLIASLTRVASAPVYGITRNWVGDGVVGGGVMLLVVLGAVILIVFIVSLNIATLLLARASGRQQEMAVRLSLGASPGRLVRQLLTESMLLSLIGGAAGIAAAVVTLGFILRFVPSNVPRLNEVRIDWVVLAFALLISLLTGLAFGLAPALQSARVALSSASREGGRGSSSGTTTGRLRDTLIVSELAFAVILMVGAGLLLRTLWGLLQENPGFNPTHVVTANTWLGVPNDPKTDPYLGIPGKVTFDRELLRRMKALPGVQLAAITSALPTTNSNPNAVGGLAIEGFAIEDRPVESSQDLRAERIRISPDYFAVFQATLLRGRSFTEDDEDGKPLVAIIDESTARKYWPSDDPLGRRVRFGKDPTKPWTTVVGVMKDIKHAFRRQWASERKNLPVKDVAAAGGWEGCHDPHQLLSAAR